MASSKKSAPPKSGQPQSENVITRFNRWLQLHEKAIFWSILGINLLFSILLFDAKISTGGDDSGYLERAHRFLKGGAFPWYQGPLYQLILCLPLSIWGLNIVMAKSFSILFSLLSVWIFYKAFQKRVSPLALVFTTLFVAINANIQFYSSQTYTEAFFMFLQAGAFYYALKLIDAVKEGTDWKKHGKLYALNGLIFFLLTISKSVAIVTVLPLLVFFGMKRQWKPALFFLISFIAVRLVWEVGTRATVGAAPTSQFEEIMRKDMYKPELGHEDMVSLVERFWSNLKLYSSVHLYRIIHFKETDLFVSNTPLTLLTLIILSLIFLFSYRKNQSLAFTVMYTAVLCGGIFFGIQANNMQERLIIPAIPYILLLLVSGFYILAEKYTITIPYFLIFLVVLIGFTLKDSLQKSNKNIPVLKANLKGDQLYGFTPDWVNYLQMSKYCADSLPSTARILARKANMSYVYTQGSDKFLPCFGVPYKEADSLVVWLKSMKTTHIMVPKIRANPKVNDGNYWTTMHNIGGIVAQKFPLMLKEVKNIGGDLEEARLYEVDFSKNEINPNPPVVKTQ